MSLALGTLALVPAASRPELLAPPVAAALALLPRAGDAYVAEIDAGFSDTAAFCERYGVGAELAANCVVLEARRAERTWHAACVVLGSTRADVNGAARRTLDARKVSFAPIEAAVAATGMAYGAITPVGLPADWPVLVDRAVAGSAYVIIGSGIRQSKLAVPGSLLASLPNARVIEDLGQRKAA